VTRPGRASTRPGCNRAGHARKAGEWDETAHLEAQRLELARTTGDSDHLCAALIEGTGGLHATGDLEQARALGREGLALARRLDRPPMGALHNLAFTEVLRGDYAAAEVLNDEAIELAWVHRSPGRAAHSLYNLGLIRLGQQRYSDAELCFREALPDLLTHYRHLFGWALIGMSDIAWRQGDTIRSARLRARAEALFREIAYAFPAIYHSLYEESASALHQARARTDVEAAWWEGETMSPEEALDYALSQTPAPTTP
jgi:hypothetical protein